MNSKRILVVDDQDSWLCLAGKWLLDAGYNSDTAISGLNAIELLQKITYDLIVVDLYMPGISGLKLHDYIKSKYDTPIVVLSNAMYEYIRELPFKYKFQKPLGSERFIQIINGIINELP